MTADRYDARLALRAGGLLGAFNRAGVLAAADVHVAGALGRLGGEADEDVLLAAALAVRAARLGSVCIDLAGVREEVSAEIGSGVRRAAQTLEVDPAGESPGDDDLDALPWPDPATWSKACAASPLVATDALVTRGGPGQPLRLVGGLLYLDRYWRQEQLVRLELDARAARPLPEVDGERLRAALDRYFAPSRPGDGDGAGGPDHQRLAAAACATGWFTVIAGGPGTGKTTTVARLLAVLADVLGALPRVALAAPTGKAAARLQQAVADESTELERAGVPSPGALPASTLHRLLGARPGSRPGAGSRFRHDRTNRLPFDVVVVDETSMVPLTLMARLLDALRPDARLVLVGDPDQLASVEAGAVLGDLVHRPARGLDGADDPRTELLERLLPADLDPPAETRAELRTDVVRLRRTHRFGGAIAELAEAIRAGDADRALGVLRGGGAEVSFLDVAGVDPDALPNTLDDLRADVVAAGRALHAAALDGDAASALAALDRHRLLCAHRRGPYGVARWSAQVERWLREAVDGYAADGDWYVGRPLIVTANDYDVGLYNGDTGVIVRASQHDGTGAAIAAFGGRGAELVCLPPHRLSTVQTVHAMTVHRGQGSQFERVTVLLPPADAPLLTRELLYTAVTRAQQHTRLIGTPDAVRAAVSRPVIRASGLRRPHSQDWCARGS